MRNKYFEELKEEGLWDDEDDEIIPADPEEDERAVKRTFIHVVLTICVMAVLEILICLFLIGGFLPAFTRLKWTCMLGVFIGSSLSVFLFFFMKKQIEEIVDLEENKAKARLKLGAIFRILIVIAVLAGALVSKLANPIAVLVGLLNLKGAAMLQPFLDKMFKMS